MRKPERLHVVEVGAGQGSEHVWREVGRTIGFGTASLSLAARPEPQPAKKRIGRRKSAA